MKALLGLLGSGRQTRREPYTTLPDEGLLRLIFTEGDRLPLEFAREVIARGERVVPRLEQAALDRGNWERGDAGWCSTTHACFLLGAIGGKRASEVLLKAFDLSEDADNDWLDDEWASIFGTLGPDMLAPLKERSLREDADDCWRHRALCGMAAVGRRRPELQPDIFSFIARLAADEGQKPEVRIWAGGILLDFRLKAHEGLLLALAELPENDAYYAETVEAELGKPPHLYWYRHDWLEFYSPDELRERLKRWKSERLSENAAWGEAMAALQVEEDALPPLTKKEAAEVLGELLPLAQKAEANIQPETAGLDKDELLRQYALAMELHTSVREDRARFRVFEAYLDDLLGWLTSLAFNLAAEGLVEEGARLGLAWGSIREPEIFLADRAVILAEAGREAEARAQLATILEAYPRDAWVQIKAGDAYAALKDWSAAEERYHSAEALADRDDRAAIRERRIHLLRQSGRATEAEAMEEQDRQWEANRRSGEQAWARSEPVVRQGPKIGRNEPCPCGSGSKYKKCCLGKGEQTAPTPEVEA